MQVFSACLAAIALAFVMVHYEALRAISRLLPTLSIAPRPKIVVVIGGALCAHLAEAGLYALTYWLFIVDGIGRACPDMSAGMRRRDSLRG